MIPNRLWCTVRASHVTACRVPTTANSLCHNTGRLGRVTPRRTFTGSTLRHPDPDFVDVQKAPFSFEASSAVVYPDFVSEEQADGLTCDLLAALRRRRYEKGHWDAVIVKYKEMELLDPETVLSTESLNIIDNVRRQLQHCHILREDFTWLPCHAIDLHKDGELNAHVDSIRFSGDIVAGLSLLSSSVMRLVPDDGSSNNENNDNPDEWVDLYLPARSLYVLSGPGRFQYSHQLLPSGSDFHFQGEPVRVERDHRLSLIFRDTKDGGALV